MICCYRRGHHLKGPFHKNICPPHVEIHSDSSADKKLACLLWAAEKDPPVASYFVAGWCYRVAKKYLNVLQAGFFIYVKRKIVDNFKTIGPLIWKSMIFKFYMVLVMYITSKAKGQNNTLFYNILKIAVFDIKEKVF